MALSPTLVSSTDARGRQRIVYTLGDGVRTFGPFVDHVATADVQGCMNAAAAATEASLADREVADAATVLNGTNFIYATAAQFRAEIRERFRTATGYELHRLARWALARMTDTQMKAAFGLSDAQLVTFKARLATMRDRLNDMDAEAGQ